MTKIIVDSTCDLPGSLTEKYGIISVPLVITLDDKAYLDKVDIQPADIYAAMNSGITPKTAQIDLDCLTNAFEACCREGHDFIYIAFSSSMSCTCHTASVLLADIKEKYPDIKAAVVDSKGGSMATGLVALQAARLVEKDYSFSNVLNCIVEMTEHTEHIFTILDLKWLIKGGRIDPIAGAIGTILGVKPILHVKNGSVSILKKARGTDKAISALVDVVADRIKDFPEQLIGIAHTGGLSAAKSLQKSLEKKLGSANFIINEIGSVLASHIGVGALGVFFFNKKFMFYLNS